MTGEYRFLRHQGGVTAFARVSIESRPNDVWTTILDALPEGDRAEYAAALEGGIDVAASAHTQRGGAPQIVAVTVLEQVFVDTKADAVRCAAAMAAWKSWDHPEADGLIRFADGEWGITFP